MHELSEGLQEVRRRASMPPLRQIWHCRGVCRLPPQGTKERYQARPLQEARWKMYVYLNQRYSTRRPHILVAFTLDPPYDGSTQQSIQMATGIPGTSSAIPFIGPVGFPPGFFGQYAPAPPKPGDPAIYCPHFYLATPIPAHGLPPHQNSDGEPTYHHPHFYPTTFLTPYPQPYAPYMMPHRPDGQVALPSVYPGFPPISGRLQSGTSQQDQRDDRSEVVTTPNEPSV